MKKEESKSRMATEGMAITNEGMEPGQHGPLLGHRLPQETLDTLRSLHRELELEDAAEEPEEQVPWDQVLRGPDAIDMWLDRIVSMGTKLAHKLGLTPPRPTEQEVVLADPQEPKVQGDELTRELEDAWNLYTRGMGEIPCRSIGYVLRILGQNPTEDEIVEMVMKANCDWEGLMTKKDFLGVSVEILKASCDQMDDVKAAFRVFDHNNDGSISKEELREAMVNFGTRCTEDDFTTMFAEADKNDDGYIDFDEFVLMMLPSTGAAANQLI